MVITSASHAEGHEFDPRPEYYLDPSPGDGTGQQRIVQDSTGQFKRQYRTVKDSTG